MMNGTETPNLDAAGTGPGRGGAGKRRLRKCLLIGGPAAAVVVLALAVAGVIIHDSRIGREAAKAQARAAETPQAPVIAPPRTEEKRIIIPPRSNLAQVLGREGFSAREIQDLRDKVKPVYNLGKIRAGHAMRITRTAGEPWNSIEYDIDDLTYVSITNGPGGIEAKVMAYPFEIRTAVVSGTIESTLIGALNKVGEADPLAIELSERCFGWDIDFVSDLRKGDTFTIMFERKIIKGVPSGYRNILAAEFVNGSRVHRAFRFTYPDTGVSDYFDEQGGSKRREFMRSPLKFSARITSRFSYSRFHPILRIYRPHLGVDYAAPIGSEVQATADGRVEEVGWNGGAGRMLKLKHKNHYETAYLHLSRFAPGIQMGTPVRAGDIIAYTGSSGESTGPHLDYRVYYNGTAINPLSQKFEPAEPVRKEYLDAYKKEARKLTIGLDIPKMVSRPLLIIRPL